MKILIVEPFFEGSQQQWAEGLQKYSSHQVELLCLSAKQWKCGIDAAALALALQFLELDFSPDLLLVSDKLDLCRFLALSRPKSNGLKTAIYFHENKLSYPWSPQDAEHKHQRDNPCAFVNYSAALAADLCFFNSNYHQQSFLEALPAFLKQFPASNIAFTIEQIAAKSKVLTMGVDLARLEQFRAEPKTIHPRGVILWNHSWEDDKNPDGFFNALFALQDRGIDFRLVVLGEQPQAPPPIFEVAKLKLADKILHWGYVDSFESYVRWLWQSDLVPMTSIQDFFGQSMLEAVYCNVKPLMPKRLAYPEHFQQPYLQDAFFYKDEQDLVNRLQGQLIHIAVLRKQQTQQYVKHYDWKNCIAHYDECLNQAIK